jgi:hypothetical protein
MNLSVDPADVSINENGHVVVKDPVLANEVKMIAAKPTTRFLDSGCNVNVGCGCQANSGC